MTDAAAALQQLATSAPADLTQKRSGLRMVRALFEQCRSAGLTTASPTTDVEALGSVFDVALRNGLGCLVLDYIQEVCSSSSLVSSDPIEAALLDGATVEQWCASALQRCKQRVLEQLNNIGLPRLKDSSFLQQECGCISALLLVVKALDQPGSSSG
ncbi:histone deacetylase hos1 [Varicellaria rhodocarpa]|nr:histone deacetylase hos1 [Varicellaria rhodocarpa]